MSIVAAHATGWLWTLFHAVIVKATRIAVGVLFNGRFLTLAHPLSFVPRQRSSFVSGVVETDDIPHLLLNATTWQVHARCRRFQTYQRACCSFLPFSFVDTTANRK